MLQHCFAVYLMFQVIIQFSNESVDACNILHGNVQENKTTKVVGVSNTLPVIFKKNGTIQVLESSNILHVISQENVTTKPLNTSNTLPGIAQECGTTEIVKTSNILADIAQENGTTERVDTSNILYDISQENLTIEVVDESIILSGIIEQSGTREVTDAFNILPGILEENGTTVVDKSNILLGIVQESGSTKVVEVSNILQDIAQENGTTELVHASNVLPGISQENLTTAVAAFNVLSNILKINVPTEIVHTSNISPSIAQKHETTEIIDASKILPAMAHENGKTELLAAPNILRGIVQENRTAEAVEASHILPKQNFESLPRSCYDLQKLGGVCKNKDGTIIESDPVSGVKKVYELTFNDTKYLPARSLFGFSIRYLLLRDSDVIVDENVLDGIVYLREFYVYQSNIKIIPDFSFVKETIRKIMISLSPLTSLEGKSLQNLTMVKEFVFNEDSIRFIHPDVFKGTESVVVLDLSRNLLTSIPPNLLDHMKNLEAFFAAHNNLLHIANIFSITHPKDIRLYSNNITDIESLLSFDMDNVVNLELYDNPIKKLTADTFNGKIDNVAFLGLSHCKIQNFSSEYFLQLETLEDLDLSYNLIEEDYDAYSESFIELHDGMAVLELDAFSLKGNRLRSIRKILKYKRVFKLYVSENQIQYLTDDDFRFLQNTQLLELQKNEIQRIDTDTFKPISTILQVLHLTSNSIKSLNGSIRYLSELIELHLGYNLIQSFASDEFKGLKKLSELYLQHNSIKILWQFQQLPNLQHLNITHNNIETIMSYQVPKILESIYLTGNTLECDCRLQPFLLRLHTKGSFVADIDICTHYVHTNSNCPDMCSCGCSNFGDDYFMSVDCSSKSLSAVPQFLKDGFTVVGGNKTITSTGHSLLVMKQNLYPSFDLEDHVLGVNLENNSLESIEGIQLPQNLIQLYLANNKLRSLPDSILKNQDNLKNVSVSGNPWNCDCDALKFKRWLTSPLRHGTIQDIQHVRCGTGASGRSPLNGKAIWTLSDRDLCPDFTISISIGLLTVVILCLAAIIVYRKYELNIKVSLHSYGFTFVKEKDLDYNKVFDAFLSFCQEDDTFVTDEIISVIEERDPSIHLCIHNRHFMAGEHMYDNIIWAVQNSKRTVLVLSKDFLDNEWCVMEYRTAHTQSLEDKMHRIVVIKVGDLPTEIDPAIKAFLDSTTYLTWGERNFWNKLLFILPSGSRARNQLQEV